MVLFFLAKSSKNSLVLDPFDCSIKGYLFNSLIDISLLIKLLYVLFTTKQSVILLHFVILIS